MQSFLEVLMDGTNFTLDLEYTQWSFKFGKEHEYELCLEPASGGQFMLALYQKQLKESPYGLLMWGNKVPMKPGYSVPTGPGDEQEARRKAIRAWLVEMLAEIDKADEESGKHEPL